MSKHKTIRLMDIQAVMSKNQPDFDMERLNVAYIYAAQKHYGQIRQSGEAYLSHPLCVAYILAEMNMDVDSVIVGMLHDTLEDTDASKEELEELFGEKVAFLVDGLTKISKMEFKSKEEKQAESFRKMLISMSEDIRVILIKLADRLHNMRTIDSLRPDKQERIAKETLEIYAPIAHRLGIAWIKWELEDLSFRVLNPVMYQEIAEKVKMEREDRENYLKKIKAYVGENLAKEGLEYDIEGRPKHFYSIYSKISKKNTSFEEIFDLLALRILVNTNTQCYTAMGVIHNIYKPIPSRFKDFIAMPKANLYQSLHTTVIGPDGLRVEFQIRTHEMHKIAEEGIAAHWKYKEGKEFDPKSDKQFVWLRQLLDRKDLDNATEFVETLKSDVNDSEIFTFTPNGDVIELPVDASPIDFAYAIHSKVGDRCVGAKVNGRMVPLKYKLQGGERVEIVTSSTQEPRKDWLQFVKTGRAKQRINAFIRKKESDKAILIAEGLLEKEFKQYGYNYREKIDNPTILKNVLDKLNLKNKEEMFINIGYGRISARKIVHMYLPKELQQHETEEIVTQKQSKSKEPFKIDGIDNVLVNTAGCCKPLPGDEVVGYISSGRGIIVHKANCKNLKSLAENEERIIPVIWDSNKDYKISVQILVMTQDKPGMMNSVTAVIKDHGINILEYSGKSIGGDNFEQKMTIEIGSKEMLDTVIKKLEQVKGMKYIQKL